MVNFAFFSCCVVARGGPRGPQSKPHAAHPDGEQTEIDGCVNVYLTAFLRIGAASLNLDCETTAGSLRATGASALLAANAPIPLIKLMGRWRSDEVFRYLHLQTESLTASYASNMLQAAP